MVEPVFLDAMERILREAGDPPRIVVGLSGGMDSVALARLLATNRTRLNLDAPAQIIAAHLNHGLRAEAEADGNFCRSLARELGLGFMLHCCDAAKFAEENGLGVEEAGRRLRYHFFNEAAGLGGLVLTGHHADDQAETILMNLRRGAHRRGLSGMRPLSWVAVPPGVKVRVGRPLLGVPRADIAAYAAENNLAWREDATNADTAFTRNRIRHRVIPMLENILPGFRERLLTRAAAMAREEEGMAAKGAALAASHSLREQDGRIFRIDEESLAEPERLIYALRHIVEEEMGGLLPYGAVLSRLAELAEGGRLGETLSLPGMLRVRKEADGLFFFYPGASTGDSYGEVVLPDPPFTIRAYGLVITARWEVIAGRPPADDMIDPDVEWLNPASVRWPLRLRPPREGERFRPLGAPGGRKIQDILVDCKVPRRKRGLPRVVADYGGVVWLWPVRLAHRVRLPGGTMRALRLEIREAT